MKENRYFKNRDIRAVENPYDASFELAEYFSSFSHSLKLSLKVLIILFIYYSVVIIAIVIFNLVYGTYFELNIFSVAFSIFMLILTFTAINQLIKSHRFLKDLGSHQDLMLKIKIKVDEGHYNRKGKRETNIGGSPIEGLIKLIVSTSEYSKKIARTFKLIIGFISVWFMAGILYLSIQFYRFGTDASAWKFDWLLPGGIDFTISVLAIILIFLVRAKFDFVKNRYESIEYAMTLPVVEIPKGRTPIERYKNFIISKNGYKDLAKDEYWIKDNYFDAELDGRKGRIFIKYQEKVPQIEDIEEFNKNVINKGDNKKLDRAIIIYKEDLQIPLSDATYNFVIYNPIKLKKEICAIQLVVEGEDGIFDFTPVISF
jgi:hypothetical protein